MVSMKNVLTLCSPPSAATKHYIIKFVLHPPSEVCEHSSCVSTLCCVAQLVQSLLYVSCIICSPNSMRNYVCQLLLAALLQYLLQWISKRTSSLSQLHSLHTTIREPHYKRIPTQLAVVICAAYVFPIHLERFNHIDDGEGGFDLAFTTNNTVLTCEICSL